MLTTMALAAVLAALPAQPSAGLDIKNVRPTHGMLGPTRHHLKLLPGDNLYLSFDIEGLKADAEGKVRYSLATELTDASGKVLFRQPPQNLESINSLGGGSLCAYTMVDVGPSQPAGKYGIKVTVTDRASNQSKSFSEQFEVLPRDFGLVRLAGSPDAEGQVPCGLLTVGQPLWVNGLVVGFDRDAATKQPNVQLELRLFDETGKPTTAKPFTGTVDKGVRADAAGVPIQFLITLNRPGKFSATLKAVDKVSGKSATFSFPFLVHSRTVRQ
jgi:hypothetical protein